MKNLPTTVNFRQGLKKEGYSYTQTEFQNPDEVKDRRDFLPDDFVGDPPFDFAQDKH